MARNQKSNISQQSNDEIQQLIQSGQLKRTKIDDDIQKFLESAQQNRLYDIESTLKDEEKRKKLINESDANRRTALYFATYNNNKAIVDLLLENGADPNISDFDGYTPLMNAIKVGNTDIAKKLINSGSDIDAVSKEGFTPLHLALLSNDQAIAEILLEKDAKVSTDNSEYGSVLHAASGSSIISVIDKLVEKYPKLLASLDCNNMTPLHIAIAQGNTKMSVELIKLGADVNAVAMGGCTPLHIAADSDNYTICKALIDKGAVLKMDSEGCTPMTVAKTNKSKSLEELFSKCTIDTTTYKGKSAKPDERADPENLKKNGNKAYNDGEYELALHWYQLAIDVEDVMNENRPNKDSIAYMLYSNKSACNYNMKNYQEALVDAEKSIELAPQWPKGYLRKAMALNGLGRKDEEKQVREYCEKELKVKI
eukprot:gene11133-13633_t